jgi:hypothetical protein
MPEDSENEQMDFEWTRPSIDQNGNLQVAVYSTQGALDYDQT